jgi:hypothetical protein
MLLRRRVEVRFEMGFPTLGIVDGVWSSLQAMKPFESRALKKMYNYARAEKSRRKRRPPRFCQGRMAHRA